MRLSLNATSLLVVDAQCGFTELCPDELPIPGGLAIVPAINALLELPFARIDATQDWHPATHCSFFGRRDNRYPPHCIMGTRGAEFLPGLRTERFSTIWRKGYHEHEEAYAVTAQHPGFAAFLRQSGISTVVICGLATNICCYYSARDLKTAGFDVCLVEDAGAGIDIPSANLCQRTTRKEARKQGIHLIRSAEIEPA